MNDVSDDLLVEILVRLPDSRSAIRCSAVCKRWNSLIAGDNDHFVASFIRHHRSRSGEAWRRFSFLIQRCQLLFRGDRSTCLGWELFSLFPERDRPAGTNVLVKQPPGFAAAGFPSGTFMVRASFEDLLLVSWSRPDTATHCHHYFLINPFTRRSAPLPAPPSRPEAPSGYSLAHGPGHAYRVALFHSGGADGWVAVSVFSSEIGEWAQANFEVGAATEANPALRLRKIRSNKSAVVARGGTMHWPCRAGAGPHRILALEPFGMRWGIVEPPERWKGGEDWPGLVEVHEYALYLGACRDRLRACRLSAAVNGLTSELVLVVEVFEVEEESASSWRFVHGTSFTFRDAMCFYVTASFHPSNPDLLFLYDKSHVSRYDMSQRRLVMVTELRHWSDPELTVISHVEPHWPTPLPRLQ